MLTGIKIKAHSPHLNYNKTQISPKTFLIRSLNQETILTLDRVYTMKYEKYFTKILLEG